MKVICTVLITLLIISCGDKGPSTPAVFCDTTCQKDTIKFTSTQPMEPFVYISVNDCIPDTLIWSHAALESFRKMDFANLIEKDVKLDKKYLDCFIKDTSHAWLEFNDCNNGRGYQLKLPFNKKNNISTYKSALTKFDPKFKIEEGLAVSADYTFLYIEDKSTGKTAKVKIAGDKELKIDWNQLHKTFDSAHVTRTRVYVELFDLNEKKTVEKNITL